MVATALELLIPWIDRNYPSLLPIFARRQWRISGARLELAVAHELEAELVASNREPVQLQLGAYMGVAGVALYTYVDPELAQPAPDQPLTIDERRRRLEEANPHFVLLEQTFQTFLDA